MGTTEKARLESHERVQSSLEAIRRIEQEYMQRQFA